MARRYRRHLAVGLAALAAVLLVTTVAFANWRILVDARSPMDASWAESTASFDVALVPGCHVDGLRPAPTLAARLSSALRLYRSNRVRRILVTGNGSAGETAAMNHWLVERGVPSHDILVDDLGTRTLDSMQRAAQNFGVRSVVVCTQKLDSPRALFLARGAGLDAVATADLASDASWSVKRQTVEALKRTLAFVEVRMLGHLDWQPTAVAVNDQSN